MHLRLFILVNAVDLLLFFGVLLVLIIILAEELFDSFNSTHGEGELGLLEGRAADVDFMQFFQLCDLLRQLCYLRHCNSHNFDPCKVLNHRVELAQGILIQNQASEHGPRWRREEALWNDLNVVIHQVELLQAAQGVQLLGKLRHPVRREVEHGQLSEDGER